MLNLHIHSNYSLDGTLSIDQIVLKANSCGLDFISITDHNTVKSYYEQTEKLNGKMIYGLEADAVVDNITLDFLCYGFELDPINEWCSKTYLTIEQRQEKIFAALIKKCNELNIKYDDSIPYNSSIEYAHDAMLRMLQLVDETNELLQKFNINNSSDFYRNSTSNPDFPLYVNMSFVWPKLSELIEIMHQNGGKVFIAHPYKYKSINYLDVLNKVKEKIDGIEIQNNNTEEEMNYLYNYAKENNLLISAGTDYHDNQMLSFDLDESIEEDIVKSIKKI